MGGIFRAIEVSGTGMTLQRKKMDAVAQNIANAESTRSETGGAYRRKRVVVAEAAERAPFRTIMSRARSELVMTDARHLPGKIRQRQEDSEISRVGGMEIEDPTSEGRMIYDPNHPDADEAGMVMMPDIDIVTEMVDMMAASRAYEANTMAILTTKEMAKNAMEI